MARLLFKVLLGPGDAPSISLGKFAGARRSYFHRVGGAELLGHGCKLAQIVLLHRVRVSMPWLPVTRLVTAAGAGYSIFGGCVLEAVFLRVGVTRLALYRRTLVSLIRQRTWEAAADEVPGRVRREDHE